MGTLRYSAKLNSFHLQNTTNNKYSFVAVITVFAVVVIVRSAFPVPTLAVHLVRP